MLRDCYSDQYMHQKTMLGAADHTGEEYYKDVNSIFKSPNDDKILKGEDGNYSHFITNSDDEVSDPVFCKDVLERLVSARNIPTIEYGIVNEDNRYGIVGGASDAEIEEFLVNKMGYEKMEVDNKDRAVCIVYGYQKGEFGTGYPQGSYANSALIPQGAICWGSTSIIRSDMPLVDSARKYTFPDVTQDNYILEDTDWITGQRQPDTIKLHFKNYFGGKCGDYSAADDTELHFVLGVDEDNNIGFFHDGELHSALVPSELHDDIGFCEIENDIVEFYYAMLIYPTNDFDWQGHKIQPAFSLPATFKINNFRESAEKARVAIKGSTYSSATNWLDISWQHVYDLYMLYLTDFYGISINSSDCTTEADGTQRVPVKLDGQTRFCKVLTHKKDHYDDKVAVFPYDGNDQKYNTTLTATVGFDDLITKVQNVFINNSGEIELTEVDKNGMIQNPLPSLAGRRENILTDECYMRGSSFSWILCPTVRFVGNAMSNLYNDIVKDFLKIDSVLLNTGENGEIHGTYEAWGYFVGFANVIMIGFFLVVIFSQLTGIGIDNYGIKKALPKIIIAAVLINASFIICQLLADLSNIIGNGIEGMLSGIGDNLANSSSVLRGGGWHYSDGGAFEFILEATILTAGGGAVLGIINAGITGGPLGILIPLAFGLLVGLIAILFFFTLLGVRKAAVVTLVVVSPIAFACYMLPNMKKIVFDRWFGLIKMMLLAYPICGLVIGGSNLASGVLMVNAPAIESNSFIYYFINMLLMVVPYFFVPSLIKKSMGALGNIAQKASDLTRTIGKRYGSKAREWNNKRGINQARAGARDEARNRRWATNALNGPLPVIGRNRRRVVRDTALQALQKQQEIQANRNARLSNPSFLRAGANKAIVDAKKEQADLNVYADAKFVEGTKFENKQQALDKLERGRRYAGQAAQKAFINKLAATRDKEKLEDEIYATETALNASKQSNTSAVTAQRQKNIAALLSARKLEINGQTVNQDKPDSLKMAYEFVLSQIETATPGSEEYSMAMAQAGALQDAMMRNSKGRMNLREYYQNVAKSGNISDNVRMAASNFVAAHEEDLKSNMMYAEMDMLKDIANGQMSAADIKNKIDSPDGSEYIRDNLNKLSPANIRNCDDEVLESVVDYLNDIETRYTGSVYGSPVPPPSTQELELFMAFQEQVRDKYFSAENVTNRTEEISEILSKLKRIIP